MKQYLGASTIVLAAALAASQSAEADAAGPGASEVSEVIVTGTRVTGIKAADSAAPIQLVGSAALKRTGTVDLATALANSVPSLNIQTTGGDAAAVSIQAALRGLSPNDTLVLVNGKRRHTTSNLAVDGGSPYSGSATTDLSFIPPLAIDHVEVLTDGAAAQYGTDAVAGVVNIILKKNTQGGSIVLQPGEYYNGQGFTGDLSFNAGFNLRDRGFFDVTLENRYQDFTYTGIGDNRVTDPNGHLLPNLGVNAGAAQNPKFPHINTLNGLPQYNLYNAMYNMGYDLGRGVEFYSFGSFGYREAQHYENYRVPSKVSGFTSTGLKIYPFPQGFNPREKFDETDYSFTGGFKGELATWHWDLASTYGGNTTRVYVVNSANAQLYPALQALSATPITPQTDFYNGQFATTQWTTTLDLDNSFAVGLASPLNVGFGAEYRRETYTISPGEPSSYYGAGAQSFTGYTPLDETEVSRGVYGVYGDLAVDPIKNLHLDVAGRYEHYSDFGDATVGKITARYDFTPAIAVRGTVSTGFRAPTLAEEYYSGTNVSPTSAEVQLPPNSSAAQLAGFARLKPEKSDNYSVGFVFHPVENLQITLDAYEIDLRDRILVSGTVYGTVGTTVVSQGVLDAIEARGVTLDSGLSYTGIATFNNAASTRTDGIELTANYASDFGDYGHVDWSLGFNYNKTQLTHVDELPIQVQNEAFNQVNFLTPNSASALTTATPREKIILQAYWHKDRWDVNLRERVYGPTSQYTATSPIVYDEKIDWTGVTDLEVGYKVTKDLKVDIGANNLFDQIPPKVATGSNGKPVDGGRVFQNPYGFSPYGTNGGFYYGRVTYNF